MIRRYEIQVCDLDETIRKHQVKWRKVKSAFSLGSARREYWEFALYNTERTVYRIYDRKEGKPVA